MRQLNAFDVRCARTAIYIYSIYSMIFMGDGEFERQRAKTRDDCGFFLVGQNDDSSANDSVRAVRCDCARIRHARGASARQ